MRILFVEPDEYYHQTFAEDFGSIGEVIIRKHGKGVRTVLEELAPDVVVMELLLPDGPPGFEVLAEISEYRRRRDLPVIVFSQIDHLEDVTESINSGVTAYFVKGRDTLNDVKKLVLSLHN